MENSTAHKHTCQWHTIHLTFNKDCLGKHSPQKLWGCKANWTNLITAKLFGNKTFQRGKVSRSPVSHTSIMTLGNQLQPANSDEESLTNLVATIQPKNSYPFSAALLKVMIVKTWYSTIAYNVHTVLYTLTLGSQWHHEWNTEQNAVYSPPCPLPPIHLLRCCTFSPNPPMLDSGAYSDHTCRNSSWIRNVKKVIY